VKMSIIDFIFLATMLLWSGIMSYDFTTRKKNRDESIKEIKEGLSRRVVIIEGRCPKCDERIPDESLTEDDLNKPSYVIN
jgi:hypothetical protein